MLAKHGCTLPAIQNVFFIQIINKRVEIDQKRMLDTTVYVFEHISSDVMAI